MAGAQAQPYYGMDDRYDSYEAEPEYPPEYTDNDSYEPTEYPAYTPDYKPAYSSYGKDNRDKSKDSSSKSISINKVKCININSNINGNNTGNVSLGNKGQGYLGASSSDGSGYDGEGEEYYDNGYNNNKKQDNGFECIINNNNNNTNIVSGGGNVTAGNGNEAVTCEDCFLDALGSANLIRLVNVLAGQPTDQPNNLEEFCNALRASFFTLFPIDSPLQFVNMIQSALARAGIELESEELVNLINCIVNDFDGGTNSNTAGGLAASNINTDTSASNINTAGGLAASNINTVGGLAASFSSPPSITQGTEEDSSALEKITKLKKQWLELLP